MKTDVTSTILAFAAHLEDPRKDPGLKARERLWIDSVGLPTDEGVALAAALADQAGTRTTFRNVA